MKSLAVISIVLCLQSFSTAQFVFSKDGKIGVDFGGYHAAAGLGGSGSSGGLFAEAGTPHGQVAKAGLAGATGSKSSGGGLYAGASAGGGADAAAGLGGAVSDGGAAGGLFAAAEAGGKYAGTGLAGSTHQNDHPKSDANDEPAVLTKTFTKYKKANRYDSVAKPAVVVNDVSNDWLYRRNYNTKCSGNCDSKGDGTFIASKIFTNLFGSFLAPTRRPSFRYQPFHTSIFSREAIPFSSVADNTYSKHKSVYVGGFADGAVQSSNPGPIFYNRAAYPKETILEASGSVGVQKPSTFFSDIFNIPISTLSAVSQFLGNTASGANFQVRKEVFAETSDLKSPHVSSSLFVSPVGQLTKHEQSPPSIIEDIFNIPISTLGAVNKFLENNVGRKSVQVRVDRQRKGPHGRRRGIGRKAISDIDMDSSEEVETKVQ